MYNLLFLLKKWLNVLFFKEEVMPLTLQESSEEDEEEEKSDEEGTDMESDLEEKKYDGNVLT